MTTDDSTTPPAALPPVRSKSSLAEVRGYIAFGLRQRDSEKIGGNEAKVMYWTGYVFAMRTVENSMERESNAPAEARAARRIGPEVGLEFHYCAGCGAHRGHRPGALQCVICDAVEANNVLTVSGGRKGPND